MVGEDLFSREAKPSVVLRWTNFVAPFAPCSPLTARGELVELGQSWG